MINEKIHANVYRNTINNGDSQTCRSVPDFFGGEGTSVHRLCTSRQDHDPGDHELSLCIHLIDLFTDTAAILN